MKISSNWISALLSVLLASLFAAGCGGSGGGTYVVRADTTMTVADDLNREEFVHRANGICREAWPVILQNFADYRRSQARSLGEPKLFDKVVRQSVLAGIDFHIFDNIYRLGAPPGQPSAVEDIIGPMQRTVETGQRGYWHAHSVADLEARFRDYNLRARRYGLLDCLANYAHLGSIENR